MSDSYSSRDYSSRDSKKSLDKEAIKKEVTEIIKNYGSQSKERLLNHVRDKYKNDAAFRDAIHDALADRLEKIKKVALKFKGRIDEKYGNLQLSASELIHKGKKYAKKYNIHDDELNTFINYVLSDKGPVNATYNVPNTPFAKMLGYSYLTSTSDKLNVKDTELDIVNQIIRLYHETKSLHSQVVLQAITYQDCSLEATTGFMGDNFKHKHNLFSYVHPVIAALFLPKIQILDENMLLGNIGYIVKCKQEGVPIATKPDHDLYWALITDPTHHVCDNKSPIRDLYNRFVLQTKLWDCVLNLRQGKYYNDRLGDFMSAIDNCRSEYFDAPDLTYVKDEGTILRRLLSAFSIRPTIVTTSRLYNVSSSTSLTTNTLASAGITQITTVPMITLRLPLSLTGKPYIVDLEKSLSQEQWFIEHKTVVPKTQSIIHSRDVVIFYANRRYQAINITQFNTPYSFSQLPMTISGWEKMNTSVINLNESITLGQDLYFLKSAVTINTTKINDNDLIVGCSACINSQRKEVTSSGYLLYDPIRAMTHTKDDDVAVPVKPISFLDPSPSGMVGSDNHDWRTLTRNKGTIFIYVKNKSTIQQSQYGYTLN
jgi:hypothetical protein